MTITSGHSSAGETRATVVARLTTDEQSAQLIADAVAEGFAAEDVAVSFADTGRRHRDRASWRVAIHFRSAPDKNAVRAIVAAAAGPAAAKRLRFGHVAARDWVGASLAGLTPVAAGRFIVHGAHDRGRIAPNRIGIEIEAALAFGTGHHATTRGCLLALDRLCKARRGGAQRILDLGTGSGVLAIAAARALRRRVLATDIDADAVRIAQANARLNRVGALVKTVPANGIAAVVRAAAPFDLVLANILLRPLQRIAAPLTQLVARGGHVVLSGLLSAQANAAIAAYRGLALERRIELDGWTTLIFRRNAGPSAIVARRHRHP
jgi:ribosomal protein L11 methyltransferase